MVTFCDVHTPTNGPPPFGVPPPFAPELPPLLLFEPLGPITVRCCTQADATSAMSSVASTVAGRRLFVIASPRQPPDRCGSARVTSYKPVTENTLPCAKLPGGRQFIAKNRLRAYRVQESGQIVAQAVARTA